MYLIRNPRPDSRDDWNQFAPLIPQSAESPIKALFSKKGGQTGMIEEMSPGPAVSMARTYQQFARTCATTIFEDQVRETREGVEASCDPRVAGRVDSLVGAGWRVDVWMLSVSWSLPQPLVGRFLVGCHSLWLAVPWSMRCARVVAVLPPPLRARNSPPHSFPSLTTKKSIDRWC